MKNLLKISVVAALAGVVMVAAPLDAAYAQSASTVIKQRQSVMKEFSMHVKAVRKFVKGVPAGLTGKKLKRAKSRLGTALDMELRASALAGQSKRLMRFFPKGTSAADGVGKTRSKAVIWAKWSEFEAAAATFGTLAGGLEKAAATGDTGKIKAALAAMGKKGCGGCHKTFRAKKKKKKSS